jgi:dihydroorotase-like cyclic amidohydrolase
MNPKMGRPTLREKPLTPAEKKLRQRKKAAFKSQAAKEGGCTLLLTMINDNQLMTLARLAKLASAGKRKIDDRKIDDIIYHALKSYIKAIKEDLPQWLSSDLIGLIEECDSTSYPEDLNALKLAEMNATQLFNDWEQSQLKDI